MEALIQSPAVSAHIGAWRGVRATRLSDSRSGSGVYKLTPRPAPIGHAEPLVVKIGSPAAIAREERHYHAYVESGLPQEMRPRLVASCATDREAALCLSWVGDSSGSTLSRVLQRGDARIAPRCAGALLRALRKSWYGPSERAIEPNLAELYRRRHFGAGFTLEDASAALRDAAERDLGARLRGETVVIGASGFVVAPASIEQAGARPYMSCMVHGDCNSDNVILSASQRAIALVDFERTGRGFGLEDMIYLEASIRINFPHRGPHEAIFESERQIASGSGSDAPYATAIAGVRRKAFASFAEVDRECYYFAVAAIACRLMRAKDLSSAARGRIVASALWALRGLGC